MENTIVILMLFCRASCNTLNFIQLLKSAVKLENLNGET